MNAQHDLNEADAAAMFEVALQSGAELRQAKAALRAIYGHVTNGNIGLAVALQLVEEACCTALNDYERMQALCEYDYQEGDI
jgi:hypothetical protein